MNILETTRQIIQKHKLNEKLTFNPFKLRRESTGDAVIGVNSFLQFQGSYEKETTLQIRYFNRVPDGWYGFDVSCFPTNWLNALEEFLAALEIDSPDFEIYQIKLKYGMARIYLGNESIDAQKAIDLLEDTMQDENLIY